MAEFLAQPSTNSRRLFFSAGDENFQLLSFTQRPDGSIYIGSPDLASSKWMEIVPGRSPQLQISAIPSAGKLSIHGSGVAHVKSLESGETELRLVGNYLASGDKQALGLRHILTIFPAKPTRIPAPVASNRLSDCLIQAQDLKPYVLVFWAVPATKHLMVNISSSFHVDDLETIPPELGFGAFGLRSHSIVWFAYRTKHMARWPAESHLCFHDGFHVPFFFGTGEGTGRLDFRAPKYHLDGNQLQIVV